MTSLEFAHASLPHGRARRPFTKPPDFATEPFVTYGELAAASGVPWKQARLRIGRHLDSFTLLTHQRGCPLLSSIVVTKPNRESGAIEGPQLEGLLSAAELVGLPVTDEETFFKEQQEQVFAWAVTAPKSLGEAGQI